MTDISEVLNVEPIISDQFRSTFIESGVRALDGGQLAGQALTAALATVDVEFLPSSVHVSFIAAGDSMKPVQFEVSRDRDGRSFASRHVVAQQDGRLICRMNATFQTLTQGRDRQLGCMPNVPAPDECPILETNVHGFEVRDPDPRSPLPTPAMAWIRPSMRLGPDQRLNSSALLYASDLGNGLCDLADVQEGSFLTSLDHALWFHRPLLLDDWVLIHLEGSSLASERGWFTGKYFSQDGIQVASSAQEILYREKS